MDTITKEQGDEIISLLKQILAKGGVGSGGSGGGAGGDPGFREGVFTGWKAVRITFGFDKGVQLGDLGGKGFAYFFDKWQPREPVKAEDAALQRALAEAKIEIDSGAYVPPKYTNKPYVPKDGGAGRGPSGERPAPAPQDQIDEDVPF